MQVLDLETVQPLWDMRYRMFIQMKDILMDMHWHLRPQLHTNLMNLFFIVDFLTL